MSGVRDVDMEDTCNICSHGTQRTHYVLLDVVMSVNATLLLLHMYCVLHIYCDCYLMHEQLS